MLAVSAAVLTGDDPRRELGTSSARLVGSPALMAAGWSILIDSFIDIRARRWLTWRGREKVCSFFRF